MLTLNLGPLALPLAPLLLFGFWLLTGWAVRRMAQDLDRDAADAAVGWSLAAGLVAARVAHVLSHWSSYAATPLDMLDIRDGGFMPAAGLAVGAGVLVWRVRRTVLHSTRVVLATAGAGLLAWLMSASAVQWLAPAPGQSLQALSVPLQPLGAGPPQTLQAISQQAGGKPVVLNLWATWCGPCRAEMPILQRAQREHPEVLFILANQGESDAVIQAFLQRERLALQDVWRDPSSALGPAVGSNGLPTTVVFDAQGRRQGAHVGVLTEGALKVIVRKIAPPSASP